MAVKPVVYDDSTKKHRPLGSGEKMDGLSASSIISADSGNLITTGSDGLAYVTGSGIADPAADNLLEATSAGKLKVDMDRIIEWLDGHPDDAKDIAEAINVVSGDSGNLIHEGSDGGAYMSSAQLAAAIAALTDAQLQAIAARLAPGLADGLTVVLNAAGKLSVGDISGVEVAASGASAERALGDRFADVVNVKDFGAAGDGATDDAAAIQAALTFAGDDKLVWFPAGTYLLSTTVTGSCDIAGSGVGSTILKLPAQSSPAADDSDAVYALEWTGDQLQKTMRGLRFEVGNNGRGIRYSGSGRAALNDVYIDLLGAGVGLYAIGSNSTDWNDSVSRLLRLDNVSVLGQGGYENVGIVLINANDSRIVNSEIMGCKTGLDVRTGTGHLFLSDIHIWCGDSSRSEDGTTGDASWWRATRCIAFSTICTVTATNLYLDSARCGVYYKRPIRFLVKNFTYWDAYWQYLANETGFLWYPDELAYINDQREAEGLDPVETTDSTYVKDNTVISLDGGVVNCRFTLDNYSAGSKTFMPDNVYVVRQAPVSSEDDTSGITPAPEEIAFSNADLRLPKSYQERRGEWNVTCRAGMYTPVAIAFSRYSGCCRFLLSADFGGADYDIQITGNQTIRCVTEQASHNLFAAYDSTTSVTTLYYRPPNSCTMTVKVLMSTPNHYLFVTPLLVTRDSYTIYTPPVLDPINDAAEISNLKMVEFSTPEYVSWENDSDTSDVDVYSVFIVAGQSNAVGYGTGYALTDTSTHGEFFDWKPNSTTYGTFPQLADPIYCSAKGSAWTFFADKFYELTGRRCIIVNIGSGGSGVVSEADNPNTWADDGVGTLRRTRGAVLQKLKGALDRSGKRYRVAGLLWSQGEHEAAYSIEPNIADPSGEIAAYKAATLDVWNWFRGILGLPSLPVIVSQTGYVDDCFADADMKSAFELIQTAQTQLCSEAGVYMGFDGAKDFYDSEGSRVHMSDAAHYDRTGYQLMGEAMAAKAASEGAV